MRGIGALASLLRCDQHDTSTRAEMGQIASNQSLAVGGIEVLEHMGQQDRIEQAPVGRFELLRSVSFEATSSTFLHRGDVVVDPNPVAVDEGQTPTNATTDIEHATGPETSQVPPIRIRDQPLPERLGSAPQPIGVPRVSRVGLFHICASVA
jgi:hypothetical protein